MVSGTSSANTTESIVPGICSLLDSASLLKALGCGICVLDSIETVSLLLLGAITGELLVFLCLRKITVPAIAIMATRMIAGSINNRESKFTDQTLISCHLSISNLFRIVMIVMSDALADDLRDTITTHRNPV